MENALLIDSDLSYAKLEAAVFDGANLSYANLTGSTDGHVKNAILDHTIMPDGSIRNN
ncbi:pentapeptide repeat-containing protein [Nostoc sp.]|uniref:pentapeptide repeat-containing protein n=1 Tax=Nostoc sp. TaxID=1180 RepID=UPI002FF7DB55